MHKVLDEHWYEHNRQCPGRQEVVQEVGKREACKIEVCLSGGAQRPADDLLTHQSHDATEEN
jgi:hypothetical protein